MSRIIYPWDDLPDVPRAHGGSEEQETDTTTTDGEEMDANEKLETVIDIEYTYAKNIFQCKFTDVSQVANALTAFRADILTVMRCGADPEVEIEDGRFAAQDDGKNFGVELP